jgi:hypothetical protein
VTSSTLIPIPGALKILMMHPFQDRPNSALHVEMLVVKAFVGQETRSFKKKITKASWENMGLERDTIFRPPGLPTRHFAAEVDRNQRIVANMHDQGRRLSSNTESSQPQCARNAIRVVIVATARMPHVAPRPDRAARFSSKRNSRMRIGLSGMRTTPRTNNGSTSKKILLRVRSDLLVLNAVRASGAGNQLRRVAIADDFTGEVSLAERRVSGGHNRGISLDFRAANCVHYDFIALAMGNCDGISVRIGARAAAGWIGEGETNGARLGRQLQPTPALHCAVDCFVAGYENKSFRNMPCHSESADSGSAAL